MEREPVPSHLPPSVAAARRGKRIAVADDDSAMRALVASALRRDGYVVEEAGSGGALLALLADHALMHDYCIDLIVTDHRMPTLNGLDIASELRREIWDIPIILMTAFGDRELHNEAKRMGVTAVFDKPFEVDDLRTIVRIVLAAPRRASRWHRHS